MDFQDTQVKDKAPKKSGGGKRNANIMSGGKVDPRSKLYQRSVAGRETLANYLQGLWNEGKDEADVFMAGVNSLMKRGHGYVGAYLDSKNPGRVYQQNEAMAITDAVMSKAGIGDHPGNRLTRPDDKEEKEERKVSNQLRGMTSPTVERGPKAKPVGQQRKEGKRPSSGQARPPGGDREGLGDRDEGPVSEWQKTLKDAREGEASASDVVKAFAKEKQSRLSDSPQAQAQRKKQEAEDRARETAAPDEDMGPEEEEGRIFATPVEVGDKFKELVEDSVKANMPINKNSLEDMIQETIEILEDEYEVDPEEARTAIFKRFNNKKIGGFDIVFDPSSAPDKTEKRAPDAAPEPDEKQAPTEEQAAPEEQAPPPRAKKRGGFESLITEQPARKEGGGGITASSTPSPEQIKAIKEKVAKVPKEELIKEMEQGNLFPSGLVTDTPQTNPLEGGSTSTPGTEQPIEKRTPEETGGSLLDEEGAAKDFRKSGPEKPKPAARKPTQRSIRGLGPSAGKFDTTRSKKSGDEMLTQNLKGYGFTPKQVKEIQKSGLTEQERQTISRRLENVQEQKSKQTPKVGEERGGSLLDKEGAAKDFRKSGPPAPKPPSRKKTKSPLDQIAKTILDGIERDKAARESASAFFNRVSQLVNDKAKGASKSDVDQATASAINRKKARTTRNKTGKKGTSNNAEYQEFAQSIRSMMR